MNCCNTHGLKDQRKIFLSYRRELSQWQAHSVYGRLKEKGYDVFMDIESIGSGEFGQIILNQIAARPHYVLILTPGALERTANAGDWLRREIEYALDKKRNIVPLSFNGFSYEAERNRHKSGKFPGKLENLSKYQTLKIYSDYLPEAIEKLITRFLTREVNVALKTVPKKEAEKVARKINAADVAKIDPLSKEWILPKSWPGSWALKSSAWSGSLLTAPRLSLKEGKESLNYPFSSGVLGAPSKQLVWTKPKNAASFILEYSINKDFKGGLKSYEGDKFFYPNFGFQILSSGYYRVRAKNSSNTAKFNLSPWSNVVYVPVTDTVKLNPMFRFLLERPELKLVENTSDVDLVRFKEIAQNYRKKRLVWTKPKHAKIFELERAGRKDFQDATVVYKGEKDYFPNNNPNEFDLKQILLVGYYRVKVKASGLLSNDGIWSNTVYVKMADFGYFFPSKT